MRAAASTGAVGERQIPCSFTISALPTLKMVPSVSLLASGFTLCLRIIAGYDSVRLANLASTSRGIGETTVVSVGWVGDRLGGLRPLPSSLCSFPFLRAMLLILKPEADLLKPVGLCSENSDNVGLGCG